jgi:uncharacterized protein with HEPN domain
MPSERSSAQRLDDILQNIEAVRKFTCESRFEDFLGDLKTIYAVTRALEIISEASRHLPPDMKARMTGINWKGIAAVGNVYRHAYDSVEERFVWEVIVTHLDPLRSAVIAELNHLGYPKENPSG